MQKISSFHQFTLEIEQILEPCDQKTMPIFDQHLPKIIKVTFDFSEFLSTQQKSVYSNNSFLRYSQFESPDTRVTTPIFDHAHHNIFWSTFVLHESVSKCKKSGFFIILVWRYSRFKNPTAWLAKRILARISGTKFFPSMRFVQEYSS